MISLYVIMVKRSRRGGVRLTSVTGDGDMWKIDHRYDDQHDGVRVEGAGMADHE